jgi:hypothetical protein
VVVGCIQSVAPAAWVDQIPGNLNWMNVTVTEVHCDDSIVTFEARDLVDNNSDNTHQVGPYTVFVSARGNDQIRNIYIVDYVAADYDNEDDGITDEE